RELERRVGELRSRTKLKGKPTPEQLEELRVLKTELKEAEAGHGELGRHREDLWARVPNPPDEETPDGFTDDDAVEIRRVGEPRSVDVPTRDHHELAEAYGWIDLERGAKVSGSRVAYRVGD